MGTNGLIKISISQVKLSLTKISKLVQGINIAIFSTLTSFFVTQNVELAPF